MNVNLHTRDLELPLAEGRTLVYLAVIIAPLEREKTPDYGCRGQQGGVSLYVCTDLRCHSVAMICPIYVKKGFGVVSILKYLNNIYF